jgi:hypothetical protein
MLVRNVILLSKRKFIAKPQYVSIILKHKYILKEKQKENCGWDEGNKGKEVLEKYLHRNCCVRI